MSILDGPDGRLPRNLPRPRRYIQQEKEEEERQLDMMMEIERLKALKMYEEREKKRVTDQRRGAQVPAASFGMAVAGMRIHEDG